MRALERFAPFASQELSVDVSVAQPAPYLVDRPLSLDAVYREHAPSVARWVRRLGGPTLDVEDCVHEVFLVAQARLPSFRGEAKLTTWLYRIAHNVVRHQRRKLKLRRWLRGTATEAAGDVAEPGPSAPDSLEQAQRRQDLYSVLDRMSDRHRTAFILFELEQLSGAEIAELLDAKQQTVWVWLHRARAEFLRLSEQLREERAS
jgi:RNA polymerase sigma-70 factor (ECF subfamily)